MNFFELDNQRRLEALTPVDDHLQSEIAFARLCAEQAAGNNNFGLARACLDTVAKLYSARQQALIKNRELLCANDVIQIARAMTQILCEELEASSLPDDEQQEITSRVIRRIMETVSPDAAKTVPAITYEETP